MAMISNGLVTALVNHLWQSTALVGVAWLLALALRKNHARVRYWIWFAVSVKFLLPFSLLIAAGEWLRSLVPAPPVAHTAMAAAIEQVAQPFAQAQFLGAAAAEMPVAARHADGLPIALLAIWACGALLVATRFARGWWLAYSAKRAARPMDISADVPVLCAPRSMGRSIGRSIGRSMEPGIFGIFRPVLLLPEGILDRLTPEQLRAVIAHEMCHVRRRDNFTFAVHMLVETLFWFHPAAWWIGARLIDERERACDEAVVESGGVAETYAEGILSVCKFYVESPLACVSGITGSDLKQRIGRIMAEQVAWRLGPGRRILLATAGALALTAPLMLGLVRAQSASGKLAGSAEAPLDGAKLPKFDVVSIKPHTDEGLRMRIGVSETADGLGGGGLPMQMIIRQALGVSEDQILNEPDWTRSARYDIQAKVAPEDAAKFNRLTDTQQWRMLLPVLEERCALKFHRETRMLTVYTLEVAKGGVKMQPAKLPGGAEEQAATGPGQRQMRGRVGMSMGENRLTLTAHGATMESLSRMLSMQLGSTVIDKTGLTGSYDYTLQFAPDENMLAGMRPPPSGGGSPPAGGSAPPPEVQGPSIFAALQEQLGLKLVAAKNPMEVLVIDHVERPSPN